MDAHHQTTTTTTTTSWLCDGNHLIAITAHCEWLMAIVLTHLPVTITLRNRRWSWSLLLGITTVIMGRNLFVTTWHDWNISHVIDRFCIIKREYDMNWRRYFMGNTTHSVHHIPAATKEDVELSWVEDETVALLSQLHHTWDQDDDDSEWRSDSAVKWSAVNHGAIVNIYVMIEIAPPANQFD